MASREAHVDDGVRLTASVPDRHGLVTHPTRSMSSASSRVANDTLDSDSMPFSIKSMTRPGVPTTMCAPRRRESIWPPVNGTTGQGDARNYGGSAACNDPSLTRRQPHYHGEHTARVTTRQTHTNYLQNEQKDGQHNANTTHTHIHTYTHAHTDRWARPTAVQAATTTSRRTSDTNTRATAHTQTLAHATHA